MPSFLKLALSFLFALLFFIFIPPYVYAVEFNLKLHQNYIDDVSRALIHPDINKANESSQEKVVTGISRNLLSICNIPLLGDLFCEEEVNLGKNTRTFDKETETLSNITVYPFLEREEQPYNKDQIKDVKEYHTGNKILSAIADRAGKNNANYYTAGYLDQLRSKDLDTKDSISIGGFQESARTGQLTPEMCREFQGDYYPGFIPEKYKDADCRRFEQPIQQTTDSFDTAGDYTVQQYIVLGTDDLEFNNPQAISNVNNVLLSSQEFFREKVSKTFQVAAPKVVLAPKVIDYTNRDSSVIWNDLRKVIFEDQKWPEKQVSFIVVSGNIGHYTSRGWGDYVAPEDDPDTARVSVIGGLASRSAFSCSDPNAEACKDGKHAATHELGHNFGLTHESFGIKSNLMSTYLGFELAQQQISILNKSVYLK